MLKVLAKNGTLVSLQQGQMVNLFNNGTGEVWSVALNGRTLKWNLIGINLEPNETDAVIFTITSAQGLAPGTEIRNNATIQFEIFASMTTNETVNVIDNTAPTCKVNSLPLVTTTRNVALSMSGTDDFGEIMDYNVFVSVNGGNFTKAITTSINNSIFVGEHNKTYGFICIARDTAYNAEVQAIKSEANTTIILPDNDNDGFPDEFDNCPAVSNANQADSDNVDVGDACDVQICSNGILEVISGSGFNFEEQCDDGNNFNGDSCSMFCELEDNDDDGVIDINDLCPLDSSENLDANLDGCKDTLDVLINTTQGMNLQQGISSSLLAKLEGAQSVLNSGNPNSHQTAINKINSFKNEVEAQRGQFITNGQANLLIAMANNVIAQI